MKATILVRDLVKLIAKHGDLDVRMCVNTGDDIDVTSSVKCIDENRLPSGVESFEIYGEE